MHRPSATEVQAPRVGVGIATMLPILRGSRAVVCESENEVLIRKHGYRAVELLKDPSLQDRRQPAARLHVGAQRGVSMRAHFGHHRDLQSGDSQTQREYGIAPQFLDHPISRYALN